MSSNPQSKWHVWRMPIALNIAIAVGLGCALLKDGDAWRALACVCLGAPLVVIWWHARRGAGRDQPRANI